MSRSRRLLDLVQMLRRHRRPVTGADLAAALGVSLRTLYRDIDTLRATGAPIEGEAGLGFVLRPGFLLPPLMFAETEVDALALGLQWVMDRTDGDMALAARDALAKIAAVLPAGRVLGEAGSGLILPAMGARVQTHLPALRAAIRAEQKLAITYADGGGRVSQRVIWPFALAFFEHVRVVVAWCELRGDFRAFRADRIAETVPGAGRYPRRRAALLAEWRAREKIAPGGDAADTN